MKPTVLVVDDEQVIRDVFTCAFEEFRIIEAGDGMAALELVRRPHAIDVVVLDVMMPGINGLDVLKEVKKTHPDCAVVMLTGYSTKDVAIEALRAHADEFLEKPFDLEQVRSLLHRLVSRRRGVTSSANTGPADKTAIARQFIERNYNKSIALADIASEIFLCPKYVSRLFKEKSGMTFSRYKMQLKIQKSKELLAHSPLTVSQIGYKVGYQNPDAFMKVFKRLTGMRPLEYRASAIREKSQK